MSRPGETRRSRGRCGRAPGRGRIGVVVAIEARLDREGVLALLETRPDLRVLGGAGTLPEALALCLAHRPRVLLLSTLLGDPRDPPAAAVIRLASPETRIVAIAPHAADRCALLNPPHAMGGESGRRFADEHRNCLELALAHGAVRSLRCDASPAALFAAIGAAAEAPAWAPDRMFANHAPVSLLSPQERRVARRVGEGDSNKEIATVLGISDLTVKKHIGRVLHKLGLHDRLQLGVCVARHPLAFAEEALPDRPPGANPPD